MSSDDVLTQAAQRAQRIIADHCFGPFASEAAEERAMDIAAVCVDDMIEEDLLALPVSAPDRAALIALLCETTGLVGDGWPTVTDTTVEKLADRLISAGLVRTRPAADRTELSEILQGVLDEHATTIVSYVDDSVEFDTGYAAVLLAGVLIARGLVRTPVTAEQIETAARELHRRDLGDVNAWLHEPEHRRDMWRSKTRTVAKALGLSVAEGGDHVD